MHFNQGHGCYSHIPPYVRNSYPFTLIVEGEGRVTVPPNQANITLGVVTENTEAETAQQKNSAISKAVINALSQLGIEETAIRTTNYSVYPRYDYIEGESILKGYGVEHLFEVTVHDLSMVGAVYDAAIKNGANRSGSIQFLVANPEFHYRIALKEALQNAYEKAEEITQIIGASLATTPIKIKEYREQQEPVYPRFTAQAASLPTAETPPIQTGDFTIKARATVIYAYSS